MNTNFKLEYLGREFIRETDEYYMRLRVVALEIANERHATDAYILKEDTFHSDGVLAIDNYKCMCDVDIFNERVETGIYQLV